jgi:hypothetical protein
MASDKPFEQTDKSDKSDENPSKGSQKKFSRRRLLKYTGAGGILTGLSYTPTAVAESDDRVEIPILKNWDTVIKTASVPRQWYNHTIKSREAKSLIESELLNHPGVNSVGIGKSDTKIGELNTHNITVTVEPGSDASGIPDEVQGIPVKIRYREELPEVGCSDHYNIEPDPIIGGIRLQDDDRSDCGTIGCRVGYYSNGSWDPYFWSACHTFRNDTDEYCGGVNYIEGKDWYQYTSSETVGVVEEAWQKYDSVLLDLSKTTRNFSWDIVGESASIAGRVTDAGVSYLKSNNKDIIQRGINTGKTQGQITEEHQTKLKCTFDNNLKGMIETNAGAAPGDSGGPGYYIDDGNVYIAMIVNHGDYSVSRGMSARRMNSEQDFYFGGSPWSGP